VTRAASSVWSSAVELKPIQGQRDGGVCARAAAAYILICLRLQVHPPCGGRAERHVGGARGGGLICVFVWRCLSNTCLWFAALPLGLACGCGHALSLYWRTRGRGALILPMKVRCQLRTSWLMAAAPPEPKGQNPCATGVLFCCSQNNKTLMSGAAGAHRACLC
jgi:hypothetical protein